MERIIHQIWLGDRPLPSWFEGYSRSWKEHFPEWDYRLWTDRDLDQLLPRMVSAFAFASGGLNVGLRSDILRLELLRLYGGIYADVDFECLKPFPDLLTDGCFCYGDELPGSPGNALLACSKGHEFPLFMLEAIARYLEGADPEQRSKNMVQSISGPMALRRALATWVWCGDISSEITDSYGRKLGFRCRDIVRFHQPVFYPYSFKGNGRILWEKSVMADEVGRNYPLARAVHHWAATWI